MARKNNRRNRKPIRRNRRGRRRNNPNSFGKFKNSGRRLNIFNNLQPTHVVSGRGVGFPDQLDMTLVYSNSLQLTSNVGEQQMTYEGNNPWDPDPQLGGQSADQYQVLSQVYKYCRVYGSAIEVNYNIVNGSSFQCLVAPKAENAPISYEMMMCLPRCKTGRMVSVGGITSSLLRNNVNTAALYGIRNLDWDISNTFSLENVEQSTSVIEPLRKWYWHVAFQNNASQQDLNGACKIRIFYRCHFYGRKFQSVLNTVSNDGDEDIEVIVPGHSPIVIDDPPEPLLVNSGISDDDLDPNIQLSTDVQALVKKFANLKK